MLAAARKLWLAPLLVLQHSSLLSTATCNSFVSQRETAGAADFCKIIPSSQRNSNSEILANTALLRSAH